MCILNINGRNDLKLLVGISDTSYARVCYLHRYLCMRTRVQTPISSETEVNKASVLECTKKAAIY